MPTSQRPYLLRALHEWMSDNGLTPQLVVDVSLPGVQVPAGHAEDGRIILNVSWTATGRLELGNEEIRFEARFGGVSRRVHVPVDAVIGIFARICHRDGKPKYLGDVSRFFAYLRTVIARRPELADLEWILDQLEDNE